MSVLLSVYQLSKSFGARTLFKDITFSIESGQRIGLVGPNGAGKSTLLQILASETSPDAGELGPARGLRIGYLKQKPQFKKTETVLEALLGQGDEGEALGKAYELISRLGLDGLGEGQLVSELSGGWQKRVAIARELMKEPGLFLMDEPTNHLDVESILWLEDFLARSSFSLLMVSHDRLFLENTCQWIFDLDPKNPDGLIKFSGSYADFVTFKSELLQSQQRLESTRRNLLRREIEWLRRGAKARQTKQKARIERAGSLSEQVAELSEKNQNRRVDISFGEAERNPKKLIEAQGISQGFLDKSLFEDFSIVIGPKTRLGILGKNGCGKSSLVKTLIGELKPLSGTVRISDKVSVSYFEQQKQSIDPKLSLLRNLVSDGDYVEVQGQSVFAKSYLARFLFRPDQMDLPAEKLSGGEQSRLLIARLMLSKDPVLVLDEPTNDLDVATLDVLQEALQQFSGAVILISHDRYFMDQVCNQVLAFPENGKQLEFFADVLQWQAWYEAGGGRQKTEAEKKSATSSSLNSSKKKKLSFNEQRELDGMEKRIELEEQKLSDLQRQLAAQENQSNYAKLSELTEAVALQQALIEKLYNRWSELST